jgi:GT2 family glycosyltransferase
METFTNSETASTTVVICSVHRSATLEETLGSLSLQTVRPFEIIVSVPDRSHVPVNVQGDARVRVIQAAGKGLTIQRNSALEHVKTPYTLFLDDDVELSPEFIESMQALFDADLGVVLASAATVGDGAEGDTGITRERAKTLLINFRPGRATSSRSAYGCNMFVRSTVLKRLGFDESLPLYGWLEDLDFSVRCRQAGRIVRNNKVGVVHLGTPSGRMSGLRLGYSQIANPLYLWSKLSEPSLGTVLFRFWIRYLVANAVYTALFWLRKRGDRRGRLAGNVLALRDFLQGRMHPGQILNLMPH